MILKNLLKELKERPTIVFKTKHLLLPVNLDYLDISVQRPSSISAIEFYQMQKLGYWKKGWTMLPFKEKDKKVYRDDECQHSQGFS